MGNESRTSLEVAFDEAHHDALETVAFHLAVRHSDAGLGYQL